DYVDDACMNMFSDGQKRRMRAALNGPRSSLLNSTACSGAVGLTGGPDLSTFQVYPNPASSFTRLEMKFAQAQNVDLHIYSILGAQMMEKHFENVQAHAFDLNLSDFSTGVYLVELRAGNQKAVKKLVVQ
ncbi:MAG: zinc-dependent metalloprotease, partial [Bacteroidota bacterium]